MTAPVLAFQVALPLVLLLWPAPLPARSLMGSALRAAGTGASLFALARVVQWAVPVRWLPGRYGAPWPGAACRR